MKTIVVPVDFSENSDKALQVAAQIAHHQQAQIIVIHMMGMTDATISKNSNSLEGVYHLNLALKQFESFLDKDYLTGITVKQAVRNYKDFNELNDVAIENDTDLIVMGSHGSSGLSEIFVGSNTEKVVRTATVPVLVIKEVRDVLNGKAVFACDFNIESVPAFKKLYGVFELLNITTTLVYINTPEDGIKDTTSIDKQIATFLLALDGDITIRHNDVVVYNDYSIEKGIFNCAQKVHAHLIAMPTHGRRGLAHFFAGSISEDVVNHASLAVLTIKI